MRTERLDINWGKQLGMAEWRRADALAVLREVKPLVGKKVVLYGGGSLMGEHWVAKLLRARVASIYDEYGFTKRDDLTPAQKAEEKKRFFVTVKLRFTGATPFHGERTFEPHLGSWQIAKLVSDGGGR